MTTKERKPIRAEWIAAATGWEREKCGNEDGILVPSTGRAYLPQWPQTVPLEIAQKALEAWMACGPNRSVDIFRKMRPKPPAPDTLAVDYEPVNMVTVTLYDIDQSTVMERTAPSVSEAAMQALSDFGSSIKGPPIEDPRRLAWRKLAIVTGWRPFDTARNDWVTCPRFIGKGDDVRTPTTNVYDAVEALRASLIGRSGEHTIHVTQHGFSIDAPVQRIMHKPELWHRNLCAAVIHFLTGYEL